MDLNEIDDHILVKRVVHTLYEADPKGMHSEHVDRGDTVEDWHNLLLSDPCGADELGIWAKDVLLTLATDKLLLEARQKDLKDYLSLLRTAQLIVRDQAA